MWYKYEQFFLRNDRDFPTHMDASSLNTNTISYSRDQTVEF